VAASRPGRMGMAVMVVVSVIALTVRVRVGVHARVRLRVARHARGSVHVRVVVSEITHEGRIHRADTCRGGPGCPHV